MIKLIAVDLDGTLLDKNKDVPKENIETIMEYAAKGVEFAFCTGRISGELFDVRRQMPGINYAITCNGAYVTDLRNEKELYSNPLPADELRDIYDRLKENEGLFEVFADGTIYDDSETLKKAIADPEKYGVKAFKKLLIATRKGVGDIAEFIRDRKEPIGKLNIFFAGAELRDRVKEQVKDLPYDITAQEITNLEFNKKGVNKGDALAALGRMLGIQKDEIMAIGDNYNDVSMRNAAGVFVAMSNSCPDMLELADFVTLSNNEAGVAAAIERCFSENM